MIKCIYYDLATRNQHLFKIVGGNTTEVVGGAKGGVSGWRRPREDWGVGEAL
jgi:hypothetical protein